MDRKNIEKIAHNPEDKLLLAKVWDKINAGIRKNIPANTCFLSPRELEMCRFLFGDTEGLFSFGGYADAERKMLVWLPDYLEESALYEDDSPLVCLRASFWEGDTPSHRDFLGALMGAGIARESVGDLCGHKKVAAFLSNADIAHASKSETSRFTSASARCRRLRAPFPIMARQVPSEIVSAPIPRSERFT